MIEVLKAVGTSNEKFIGGTTIPLQVDVENNKGELFSYVVKIFSTNDIEQNDSMFKEFFCHELIEYFDLHTPEVALIEFNDSFLTKNPKFKERCDKSGNVHFGSKYYDNFNMFPGITRKSEIDLYSLELILAVDALIFNVDRRVNKPNLLTASSDYLLIDHEKTFGLATLKDFIDLEDYSLYFNSDFKEHLCKPILKKNKRNVQFNFEYFSYLLERLEVRNLTDTLDLFDIFDIDTNSYVSIVEQIESIKRNRITFIQFLKNFIS